MLRWLAGFAWLALFACSSTSTNEGSGGGAGAPGGGGSAGAASGGSGGGGGVLDCPWAKCLLALNNSPCKPLAVGCGGPGCDDVTQYANCACSGAAACNYPPDADSQALIDCIATDTTLAPLCLGLPGCTPAGKSCVGKPDTCCPGTTCDGNVCL